MTNKYLMFIIIQESVWSKLIAPMLALFLHFLACQRYVEIPAN